LKDQDDQRGKQHPDAQRGGKSQGREPVQDRFDGQQFVVTGQAVLDGAEDGHRANAEEQGSRQETTYEIGRG
jgi:hypothetical protein